MPAKSRAQFRLMQAAAHNKDLAKKLGIDMDVAEEFVSENKGKKAYAKLPERKRFKRLLGEK